MPEEKKKERGRVIYSRRVGDDEDEAGSPRRREKRTREKRERQLLVRTLAPLLIGFALLIGLIAVLGRLSANRVREASTNTQNQERHLSATLNRLLELQLALSRLNTEARIRAQVEAGTSGVLKPPVDLRLRNERKVVEEILPLYDSLSIAQTEKGVRLRHDINDFIELTKDLNQYSLSGFPAFRDLDAELRKMYEETSAQRDSLSAARYEALGRAEDEIRLLQTLALVTGLVVAAATIWEVQRRVRQIRRSFEALQRERQFSAQILEGTVSAIAAIDREDRIRSANAAFFELFPGAKIGDSIYGDFTTPEAMKMLSACVATRVTEAAYHGRWHLGLGPENAERDFDVYSSPLEIDGEAGQLLTLIDVTEAARAERELRRQESLAAVGQAAAQVAHEIKNPLGSIRLGVAMLRDMTRDREAISTIDLVERGIEHLNKLTVDVTQFSRRRQLALADVDLHALLDESLDLVIDKIREKQTPLERRYNSEPLEGHWDEDQLRQVFVNLFANAIDASPEKSPVEIRTERASTPARNNRNGDGRGAHHPVARITVADHGSGMDERTRTRIFEPFFTTKKRGTGLGLAIAKQIIEQHDGTIRVESQPGEGTRFIIDLPLSPGES